eukprot:COSAG01_NODE_956_length_12480_cov_109.564090_3_plen_216_part_00
MPSSRAVAVRLWCGGESQFFMSYSGPPLHSRAMHQDFSARISRISICLAAEASTADRLLRAINPHPSVNLQTALRTLDSTNWTTAVKNFAWSCTANCLPSGYSCSRGKHDRCPICGTATQSVYHEIAKCPQLKAARQWLAEVTRKVVPQVTASSIPKRGFQQLSFPDVAFAPKYYARCGFRSYSLCDPWISDGIWWKSSDRLMRSADFSSKLFHM